MNKIFDQNNKRRNHRTAKRSELFGLNVLAALLGLLCGIIAIGFRYLINFFQNIAMFGSFSILDSDPNQHIRGLGIIAVVMFGLWLTATLVRLLAKEAQGHGVPEVMETVLLRQGRIRKRVVAVKALASSLCIGVGGAVGREGPIVQIGSAVGSSIAQCLNLRPRFIKILLGCGAAGGIAATFNTPIAGVIFAIEIILLEFRTRSFIPLVIAAVMATIVSRVVLGSEPAFEVPVYSLAHPFELLCYLGLGIVSGLLGVLVIRTLYGTEKLFERLKIPEWTKPLLGGLIVGTLACVYPQIMGVGYETVSSVLKSHGYFPLLISLVFAKIVATSVTLASGGSGGVFAPSLFIGAMLGGAYGLAMHYAFPETTASSGAYALVGMAAVFSATSRATFTAIVILFEMTLDYNIILPLMFACVISDLISVWLTKETIYTKKLSERGVPYSQDMGIDKTEVRFVRDFMTTTVITVMPTMTIRELKDTVLPSGHHTFPVLESDRKVVGLVLASDIRQCIDQGTLDRCVTDIMVQPKIVGRPKDTLRFAMRKIEKTDQTRLVVVNRVKRQLLGIITGRDILKALTSEDD